MRVDLQVKFHTEDPMVPNVVAEIPGSDLADEIVMIGAHLDSWHSGTGATDNAVGSVAVMEAVRIIQALDLKPRRTIRVALWTGEEQGLFGSNAYVKKHFGHLEEPATQPTTGPATRRGPTTAPGPKTLIKESAYEKLSAYFNLDNGTGRIRGIYCQGNESAAPIFTQWIAPFADLDAKTITLANTGGTDHLAFDRVGLPGFQFIQDPMDYRTRTHHSNQDNFDRIQMQDLKQVSTIMAWFVWKAANEPERFPRKPLDATSSR
jgi:Zn-dependent M28 family amino/carboxypeptidase